MALQGTLDTFALPDVLRLLASTKKSGRLRITGGRGTGSVWVSSGEVAAVEATHAPHATESVETLFELLRFEEGAFTFDAEAVHDHPGSPVDVEVLLEQSETLLEEWREIEAVVPSMDSWVTLRSTLPVPEVTVDQGCWTSIVAVGAGATVRRIGDDLCLAEMPVSRAVKELFEAGLVDIAETAPATTPVSLFNGTSTNGTRPLPATAPLPAPTAPAPTAPAPTGPRAQRAKPLADIPAEPERFEPLDLPGHRTTSEPATDVAEPDVASLSAAFPGLAKQAVASGVDDDDEMAKQLATLSPRAATAIRAAAEATTDEERDAALDAIDVDDEPLNRGLLMKFLSSVKT